MKKIIALLLLASVIGCSSDTSSSNAINSNSRIGEKDKKIFHTPDCLHAISCPESLKVVFQSRDAAILAGYIPDDSRLCNP